MLTKSGKSFREAGTRIFTQEREAQHGIVSLLASKGPNSIKELPVGNHTIHFTSTLDVSSVGGPVFLQDITYHVTVVPRGQFKK